MQVNKGNLYTDKQYIELLKIKIEHLEEDLEAEKSINSYLSRRILKAIEYIEKLFILEDDNVTYEFKNDEIKPLLKILKEKNNENN